MRVEKIREMIADEPHCKKLRDIAEQIVSEVFRANAERMVGGRPDFPRVEEALRTFRAIARDMGIHSLPENDQDLFTEVIHPVFFRQVERSE